MLALTVAEAAPHVALTEVSEPVPLPSEAVVEVRAVSLNLGECRLLANLAPGGVHGWDLAGTVVRAAADGTGPPEGARVVGVMNPPGAWAQRVAVPTPRLGAIPDAVGFEQAACLPVAGLTALRALEEIGFVLGKRIAITGASGGVGRIAVQLARDAGADVVAVARRPAGLAELGASEVVASLEPEGAPLDGVLDGIGGPVLGAALQRVRTDGVVVSYAATVPEPVEYPTRVFFRESPGARLYGLYLFHELGKWQSASRDLERLARRVAEGRLDVQIDLVLPWEDAGSAVTKLLGGEVAGKAVLTL
jgi:NADPH:quinone reductase